MPELRNARWEKFARAIVLGLGTQKDAYIAAGYRARGNGAEVNASKLLSLTKPVIDRVRELHHEQLAKSEEERRYTLDGIKRRMALASKIAEEDRNPNALQAAEQGLARLLGIQVDRIEQGKPGDFTSAQTPLDIVNQHIKAAGLEPTKPLQDAVASVLRDAAASLAAVLERARDSQTVEH